MKITIEAALGIAFAAGVATTFILIAVVRLAWGDKK